MVNNWPGVSADQNTVYVSYQGAVHAVNASNGTLVWSFPKDKPDPSKPFYAAPTFGGDGLVIVGNYGSTLYALNENGEVQWQFQSKNTNGNFAGNFAASPLVVEDTVLAPSSDTRLYALNLDGSERWRFKTNDMLWAQPASDGQTVFLSAMDHSLYAINLADGKEIWAQDLGSSLLSAPVLGEDGTLYVTNLDGEVLAINAKNGEILWRRPTEGYIWASPLLHEGVLYVGNLNNQVFALSAEDGSIVWQKDAGQPVVAGGALVEDAVVFPTEAGNLIAWDLNGERQLWTQTISGKLYSTPVVAGENLVVGIMQGDTLLQAYNLDGQVSWPFSVPK